MFARLKQRLRSLRSSRNVLVRHVAGAVYSARDIAVAIRLFVTDDAYRAQLRLRWFRSKKLHQTTVLTWMDRYPRIFAACRELFADTPEVRILSFGCSTGEEVLTLRQYFPRASIVGAEINPRSLARCRALAVDERIAFVRSEQAELERRGPFDLIFCMAVLQRTPHAVEAQRLTSLADIYPFEKFDRQVSELDALLEPGGVLVVHHTQYYLTDATIASKYVPVDGVTAEADEGPRFDRQSRLIENGSPRGSIFRKVRA